LAHASQRSGKRVLAKKLKRDKHGCHHECDGLRATGVQDAQPRHSP